MQTLYNLTDKDLPAHCPPENVPLWNAHPKIYLELSKDNPEIRCPYCNALFVLQDKTQIQNNVSKQTAVFKHKRTPFVKRPILPIKNSRL